MGFRGEGFWCRVWGTGVRVCGVGFVVSGVWCQVRGIAPVAKGLWGRVWGLGVRVFGVGFGVQCFRFVMYGLGFQVGVHDLGLAV